MIVWLASYPKSGNTWVRMFLANVMSGRPSALSINEAGRFVSHFASRRNFDGMAGWETSDLPRETVDHLALDVQDLFSTAPHFFLKTHTAYSRPENNAPLFSARGSHGVVYIVRNPLDVAVSFARHLGTTVRAAINLMNKGDGKLGSATQLEQPMGNWTWHVGSWTKQKNIPVLVVRYEDLLSHPEQKFQEICDFSGTKIDLSTIHRAIDNTRFSTLQQQELKSGFKEAPSRERTFFWGGQKGKWREALEPAEAESIISTHQTAMKELKYLNDAGEPI